MKSYPIGTLLFFVRALWNRLVQAERILIGILFCVMLVSGGLWYVSATSRLVPAQGGMLTEGVLGRPKVIHPLFARSDVDRTIARIVFAGLLSVNEKQEIAPGLAEKYDISADGLTYTLQLRRDLAWHDAQPITAEDILYTVAVLQNPDYQETAHAAWEGVRVEKVDDYTVRFVLSRPFPGFLQALTISPVPKHIWNDIPVSQMAESPANLKPVGSGPYRIDQVKQSQDGKVELISMVLFDGYRINQPYIRDIDFVFYDTREDLVTAFENRSFTSFGLYSFEDEIAGQKSRGFTNHTAYMPYYTALFFNGKRGGVVADRSVRQAMQLAVDKNRLNTVANYGAGRVISSPILPGFLGYDENVTGPSRDVKIALNLLTQAGWNDGNGDGIREKEGKSLVIGVSIPDEQQFVRLAEEFRIQMRDIGIDIQIQRTEPNRFEAEVVAARNYDSLIIGESLGADSDPYSYWHSSQSAYPGLNLAQVENVEIDKLLEEARQTGDTNIKIRNYKRFQALIADDLPAIFFYQPVYVYKVFNRVQGIDLNTITHVSDRFQGLSRWYIATKRVQRSN